MSAEENELPPELLITLGEPITFQGKEYRVLELSEPNFRKVRDASKVVGKVLSVEAMYDMGIELVSKVSGVPVCVINDLPSSILDEAVAYVTGFEVAARNRVSEEAASQGGLPSSKLLEFEKPFCGGGNEYYEMALREPRVSERRKSMGIAAAGTLEAELRSQQALIEAVSGWHTAAVQSVPSSVFGEAAEYLTGFFVHGRTTGKRHPTI